MTATNQKLELFEQQSVRSRKGLDAAIATSNYQLAALNCRQGFKSRLMRGLVQWRSGDNPTGALTECVGFHKEAIQAMESIGKSDFKMTDSAIERVGFVAYLLDMEWSVFDLVGFEADRQLDAVLSNSLFSTVDAVTWESGMKQLREHGSSLAVETYENYIAMRSGGEAGNSFTTLETCFTKRKKDKFFSGGEQTEGGGMDNEFVVDYRLAALAKHAGLKDESVHSWRW